MLIRNLADRITHHSRHFDSAEEQAQYYLELYYKRHHARFVNFIAYFYPEGFRLSEVLRMRLMLSIFHQLMSGEYDLTLQNRRDILVQVMHQYDLHHPRTGIFRGKFDTFRQYLQHSINAVDQAVRDFNHPPLITDFSFEERLTALNQQGLLPTTKLQTFENEFSQRLDIINARCEKLHLKEIVIPDEYACVSTGFILNDPVKLTEADKRYIDRDALRMMIEKSPRIYVLRNGARIPGIYHPLRICDFSIAELQTILDRPATEHEVHVMQEISSFLNSKEQELNAIEVHQREIQLSSVLKRADEALTSEVKNENSMDCELPSQQIKNYSSD